MDKGYDAGAVHRGLETLGLDGYTAIRVYPNNALKKDLNTISKQIVSSAKIEIP